MKFYTEFSKEQTEKINSNNNNTYEFYLVEPCMNPSQDLAMLNENFHAVIFSARKFQNRKQIPLPYRRVYQKVSGLATWSKNCEWYSSLLLGAVISLFCESV
jgi:hypothetical protein